MPSPGMIMASQPEVMRLDGSAGLGLSGLSQVEPARLDLERAEEAVRDLWR